MFATALMILLAVLAGVPPAAAQDGHVASEAAIEAALQEHRQAGVSDRAAVLRVLERAEVKAVAAEAGVDLRQAAGLLATVDGEDLSALAAQARQVDEALAGGQSQITLSTTMIIIGLLVLVLLIVALK
jgi:hypothetical protein